MNRVDYFEALLRRQFALEESQDIIEWLKENIRSIPYSPMPGGFRTTETPWLEEILRACVDPEIKLVSIRAPIQSGKSMALELLLCWIIARQPGPTLYLQDQDPNARDWYETRLLPLIENCPPALERMNKKESRWQSSQFDRMHLWTLGAQSDGLSLTRLGSSSMGISLKR
jgi:phage terminase large subunit GpA-like protein